MPDDAVVWVVFCQCDDVFAAPAESSRADFQVFGFEGRRRGAESLEVLDHSGFSLGDAACDHPGEYVVQDLEKEERLDENSCDPGLFLQECVRGADDGGRHSTA